ncbi:MAG: hypothetical protein ACI4QJ_08685 [Candidatus Spyradenecus sp.]
MSTVFLCVDGSSTWWMRRLAEVVSRKELGVSLAAAGDSLGAQQVGTALAAGSELPTVRQQVWQIERQGTAIETLEVWDLPRDFYNLIFLDAAEDADPTTFEQRVNNHSREIKAMMQSLASATIIGVALEEAVLSQSDATERFRLIKFLRGVCQLNQNKALTVKPLLCATVPPALAETEEARATWASNHPEIQEVLTEFAWRPASETGVQALLALALLRCDFIKKCYRLVLEAKDSFQKPGSWITLTGGRSEQAEEETMKRVKRYCALLTDLPWPLTMSIFEPNSPEVIVTDIKGLFEGIVGISPIAETLNRAQLAKALQTLPQSATRLGRLMRKLLVAQLKKVLAAWDDRTKCRKTFLYILVFALAVACIVLAFVIVSPILSI